MKNVLEVRILKSFNVKKNSFIVLLLTILILVFVLKDNFAEVIKDIYTTNYLLLFIAIFIFFLSYLFDSLSFYYVVKQYKKDYTVNKAMRLNILTHFFNGITPLASGGQPMQIYVLHKDKVRLSDASSCVIQFYVIYQIALMIIGSICLVYSLLFQYIDARPVAMHMFIIGFIINVGILLFLIFVSFNRKFNKAVVRTIIKFLSKLHIIKNKEETIKKWDANCDGFYESAQVMKKNKKVLINGVLLQILQLLCRLSIPLFVVLAVGANHHLNYFSTIAISSFITICSCYIPIPGATGGVEYGFASFFAGFIADDGIRAVLILWRFITYFLPVIAGGIVFNIQTKDKLKEE